MPELLLNVTQQTLKPNQPSLLDNVGIDAHLKSIKGVEKKRPDPVWRGPNIKNERLYFVRRRLRYMRLSTHTKLSTSSQILCLTRG